MRVFRFYPPNVEEQRAFFAQFLGAILSLAVIGVLFWRAHDAGLRGVLLGAGAGVLFLLGRNAWQLEKKAARSQNSEIGVDENGMRYADAKGVSQFVPWQNLEKLEVSGGRLQVIWRDEKNEIHELQFGAREVEDGMELIRLLAARGQSTPSSTLPDNLTSKSASNFIPLEPK